MTNSTQRQPIDRPESFSPVMVRLADLYQLRELGVRLGHMSRVQEVIDLLAALGQKTRKETPPVAADLVVRLHDLWRLKESG